MRVSVAIPTYNSAAVIQATLDSVLRQTAPPDEILVLDDGSSDNTISILNSYQPRMSVFQQKNQGVAHTRNALSEKAQGDLVAFLDHDDLWHPRYLEVQRKLFGEYPSAAGFFAGHVDFHGNGGYEWKANDADDLHGVELIDPVDFVRRYNQTTGLFGSMSICCVPKKILMAMGKEPFRVSGVDDSYLCMVMALHGPVVYAPQPLVAYRLGSAAQSANRLRSMGLWVKVFELLEPRYRKSNNAKLEKAFELAFALKRRRYGKLLMGARRVREARGQFTGALRSSLLPTSVAKSVALWILTWLPPLLQPAWPQSDRERGDRTMNYHRSGKSQPAGRG